MNNGVLIYLITPLISAISQLILKKAADNPKFTGIRAYLNLPVMRTLALTIASVLEASSYIYVMALSFFFLKEKISARRLIGNIVIVIGIILTLTL